MKDRSRSRNRDGPGKDVKGKDKSKDKGKDKGKVKSTSELRVAAAFRLAKAGNKICPYWQSGSCNYPRTCRFSNECYLCGSTNHGAHKCPDLQSDRAKKRLGV